MKDMNMDAYRFSISWSRILPSKSCFFMCLRCCLLVTRFTLTLLKFYELSAEGKVGGGITQEGINYYNNLINELLANGKN